MKEKKITFGGCYVAFVLSWVISHSIWWGILHFFLGWFYVVYWLIKYSEVEAMLEMWMKT